MGAYGAAAAGFGVGGMTAPGLYPYGAPPPVQGAVGGGGATVGLPSVTQNGPEISAQIEVPDDCVGAILGRGGTILNQIKAASGAFIRLSNKGEYAPGTANRIVSIKGPVQATQDAQLMIHQRVQQCQQERAGQSAMYKG
uniref:K Homology domain-containing protein n=1 Tax=Fibrocapsa japonica TaxID=94617 RepID=A0A7S2UXL3_9STRA